MSITTNFPNLKSAWPLVLSATRAITGDEIFDYPLWDVSVAAQTFTLPTPEEYLSGKPIFVSNTSNGSAVFSGAFNGGAASATITTQHCGILICLGTGATPTYKWHMFAVQSAATGLSVDEVAAITGANSPSAANVFATEADVGGTVATEGALIAGASNKNPPIDADRVGYANSAAANILVYSTWTQIKAFLKTYFDTVYQTILSIASGAEVNAGVDNAKIVTAKAIADSDIAFLTDIPEASAGFDYVRTGLTGGTANDLDGINYADLSEGHTCLVNVAGQVYTFRWNAASAAAESSPDTIRADDDGGAAGRWILDTLDGNMYEYGTAVNTACQGNDARIPTTAEKAALVNYECTALTGGAAGALDALAVATLTDLEIARVVASNVEYMYQFNAAAVDAEASPVYIRPDDFGAAGVWYLLTVDGNILPYGTAANTPCEGNDARLATTDQKAAFVDYEATSLTGGGAGALDAIVTAGTVTVGAELVRVTLSAAPNQTYAYYRFEKTGVAAEASPDVIRPDDFATDAQGNWNLVLVDGTTLPYGTAADTVCVGNDARLPTTTEKAALPWAEATALTGGAAGALDALVTAGTATVGDEEVIVTLSTAPNQTFARYRFEKTGVAAESSPDVIRPDDFATDGQGNWNLVLYDGTALPYGTSADTVCVGNDARLPTTNQKAGLFDYFATTLTGGGAALDGFDGAGLSDGDTALVVVGNAPGAVYFYVLDDDDGGAESSPDKIQPDANPGTKMWVLTTLDANGGAFGPHTHAAGQGGQLTMPVALSDYSAPVDIVLTLDWTTATPEGMTITAKGMIIGKLAKWWLHIVSADPGAGGGNLNTIAFPEAFWPADVGAPTINWDVHGIHMKDTGAADTWTTLQGKLNVTAAAGADRLITVKNDVAWADNEVTELLMSGEHYIA